MGKIISVSANKVASAMQKHERLIESDERARNDARERVERASADKAREDRDFAARQERGDAAR